MSTRAREELRELRFNPRSDAFRHLDKFERLCDIAYPDISDDRKRSLFVKTIDSTNNPSWNNYQGGVTPGRWLMELNEEWDRNITPSCEVPHCSDCNKMSFDHLRSAFTSNWGAAPPAPPAPVDDRDRDPRDRDREREREREREHSRPRPHQVPSRRHAPPPRSYSMPPSHDSGSETESTATYPTSAALVPHSRSSAAHNMPPSAPTPPNEPVDEVVSETKTSISINADNGAGQIMLCITDNRGKQKKRKKPQELTVDEAGSASRSGSPGIHPDDARGSRDDLVQVIEASPHDSMLDLYKPESPTRPPTPPRDLSTPPPPPLRPRLLEGKVAVITGASRGIGRAIALGFAREGAHILAHYWGTKSDPANEEIVSLCVDIRSLGQGCTIVFGDISDPRTSETIVRRAVETYGHIDIAVGNAGMCWFRDFLEVTPELLRRHVDVNLNGNFYFVQAAARQFKRQFHDQEANAPGAPRLDYSIICIAAAQGGSGEQGAKQAHFSPTAAGIKELMRSCSQGLARYGVRCNTLAPGIVQTKMVKDVVEDMEVRGRLEKKNPFGRLGVAQDVVGPAVYLATDMSRWMTGQEIVIDGGSCVA